MGCPFIGFLQRIRVLPAIGKDPESQRSERIKVSTPTNTGTGLCCISWQTDFAFLLFLDVSAQKEEEKLRAAIRRENQQRRVKERTAARDRITANYLEPDRYIVYRTNCTQCA